MKSNDTQRKVALTVIALSVLLTACSKKIDYREAINQRGLVYRSGENTPFTGIIKNEQWGTPIPTLAMGSCLTEYKDGLKDGKMLCTSMSGVKLAEVEWHEGKKNGTEKLWEASTGKFWREIHYKGGMKDGVEEVHNPYENEVLIQKTEWANDQKSGSEKVWDLSGKILRTDLNWGDGKKTGVSRFNTFQETYKNGSLDGTHIVYNYPKDQQITNEITHRILDISRKAEILQGGSDFVGDLPGMVVEMTEVLVNGLHQPAPALQACVNAKMAEYRASPFQFQQGMMTNRDILRWENECAAGQTAPQVADNASPNSKLDACINAKIAATRKISPDTPISNDILEEWAQDCKAGK